MIARIIRFIQIDYDYFSVTLPFFRKIRDVFFTNVVIVSNLFLKRDSGLITLGFLRIAYDTPYATKTFLAAVYDFYIETKRISIFSKNPVIIDVGANIGQYLFAIKSFLPESRVYCFEPDPTIFLLLKRNATFYRNVTIFPFGLSDRAGEVSFFRSKDFSEWSSLIKPQEGRSYEKITTNVKKGDAVFKDLDKIDLLKIDVEGAELSVVRGMIKTLRKAKYLLIETSLARDMDNNTNELFTLLINEGFQVDHIGRIFSEGVGRTQGAVDLLFRNGKF